MPDFSKGRTSAAGQRRGAGRGGVLWPLVFGALLVLGGGVALVLGVVRIQEAARLNAAPVCGAGQQTGCRLDEAVTVVGLNTAADRSGRVQTVSVQVPGGGTQTVYANDHDNDLWDRLAVNQTVQAELWNGYVIRLDDGAGHSIVADDSPAVTSTLFPFIGIGSLLAGGYLLFLCVRVLRRDRTFQYGRQ